MSILLAEHLSRQYGRRVGVDSIDLEVGSGEIFGFLGPNGAGKTTTIRLLMGFLRPNAGRASICGFDCWRQSPRVKQNVGYLPGDLRLYPWLTGGVAMKMVAQIRGVDLRQRGSELAERFGLEMDLRVRKMSRGTRQKLGLILAMVHRPRLLVLDEPTSGLDPLMQQELASQLRELATEGRTVFFSSHTLSEVENLCDRVAIVRRGQIVANETLEALRAQAHRTVEIVFADDRSARSAPLPSFLRKLQIDRRRLSAELLGPAPALIQWAGQQAIDDISIGPPNLERLFRKYYHSDETTP